MAEPTKADLRRLRSLETRLEKAESARKDATAELREARRAISAGDTRLDALVAENRDQATRLTALASEVETLRAAAEKAAAAATRADDGRAKATEGLAKAQAEVKALRTERDRLAQRVKLAEAQLDDEADPVLPAADVAALVGRLVDELGAQLPGHALSDGEINLKVAFEGAGSERGFVVPSASGPVRHGELHEISFRFDRRIEPDAD